MLIKVIPIFVILIFGFVLLHGLPELNLMDLWQDIRQLWHNPAVVIIPADDGPPDCKDVVDLMNESRRATEAKAEAKDACKKAAEEKAGFRTLEWPLIPFPSLMCGKKPTDLELLEEGVEFSEEVGAIRHKVVCSYDLHAKLVRNVAIDLE